MHSPLIVFDVGNSRLKAGLFDRADDSPLPTLLQYHTQEVTEPLAVDLLLNWVETTSEEVPAIAAGSSPEKMELMIASWSVEAISQPVMLHDRSLLDLSINVQYPEKVGIDRILNGLAANHLRVQGEAALIVDSGTATTVDLIDREGVFQGGAILPGLRLSAEALHHYTQLLPRIPLDELDRESKGPIGKETREAIRAGLFWGQLGAIRELSAQILSDFPQAKRLLTGGGAELLKDQLPDFECVSHLSLRGLALLADRLLE